MIYLVLAIIAIGLAIGVRVLEWKVWWKKFDANPRNFPFHHKGRVLWHSRSVAVAAFTFCKNSLGNTKQLQLLLMSLNKFMERIIIILRLTMKNRIKKFVLSLSNKLTFGCKPER